jgi:hypothetical protein
MGILDRNRRRRPEGAAGRDGRTGPGGVGIAGLVGGAVVVLGVLFAVLFILLGARPAAAQTLADYDYENLSFQGIMLDVGYMNGSRVESTVTYGGRVDLGLLGPGVRATLGFNRWSSFLVRSEVRRLEVQLEELIQEQTGMEVPVNLGDISWSDLAIHGDVHVMWEVPFGVFTYAGLGASAHILRGGGAAIEGTFVEDLLDSIRAGLNAHAGLEVPVHPRLRIVTEGRFEVLENLRYAQVRLGGQFDLGR